MGWSGQLLGDGGGLLQWRLQRSSTYLRKQGQLRKPCSLLETMGLDIVLIRITTEQVNENRWLAVEDSPELGSRYADRVRKKVLDQEEFLVWYYEEVGSMRKGMLPKYFKRYGADEFIFTRKDVDELARYVKPENRSVFQEQIASRFMEGETVIMMGY